MEIPGPVHGIYNLRADAFDGYVDSDYCEGDSEGCEGDTECGTSDKRREMDAVESEGEDADITDGPAVSEVTFQSKLQLLVAPNLLATFHPCSTSRC